VPAVSGEPRLSWRGRPERDRLVPMTSIVRTKPYRGRKRAPLRPEEPQPNTDRKQRLHTLLSADERSLRPRPISLPTIKLFDR
jgi:hypothetical protein